MRAPIEPTQYPLESPRRGEGRGVVRRDGPRMKDARYLVPNHEIPARHARRRTVRAGLRSSERVHVFARGVVDTASAPGRRLGRSRDVWQRKSSRGTATEAPVPATTRMHGIPRAATTF